ncbi:hypothetical protein EDB19DRAFT_291406 [Suillus lakei]|nr:hypothetical protein EDB19DRAFT_291406 [Suillus lakei]
MIQSASPNENTAEYRWSWHEYGDIYDGVKSDQATAKLMKERNPRLAGLTPREVLQVLKVELKEYCKGVDPFDRKICKHENFRDWRLAVQKDENVRVLRAAMTFAR